MRNNLAGPRFDPGITGWAGTVGGVEFAKIQDGNAEQGGKIHLVISQAIMPWRRAGWVTLI